MTAMESSPAPSSSSSSSSHQISLQTSLSGHSDRVWHLSFSPSSPLLASCSSDKSIRFYSYTPSLTHFTPTTSIPSSHNRTVRSLAFSPTGTTLATASFDATVGIWQRVNEAGVEDGEGAGAGGEGGEWESLDPLEGHESECKSVAWSQDGRLLASCSRDKSVWVWEQVGPGEFECLAVLMEHSQDVKMVTWHPTEELLASASYDDTVKIFAADPYDDDWSCIETFPHSSTVWSISFSPCGNYLASAGDDLSIRIWGRDPASTEIGEAGEAKREEGGRMGPWSGAGVRIGPKEKWRWELKCEIEGAHERTIYSVDWKVGGVSESEGGLGRILSAGGDGKISVYQITKPTSKSSDPPSYSHLASFESSHGVSDVNHAIWCTISPSKAAETLRALEGADEAEDEEDEDKEMKSGTSAEEEDKKWSGTKDVFASAGDDGVVKIWKLEKIE